MAHPELVTYTLAGMSVVLFAPTGHSLALSLSKDTRVALDPCLCCSRERRQQVETTGNQRRFLFSAPSLDLALCPKRLIAILERLRINEFDRPSGNSVAGWNRALVVLRQS